MIESINDIKTYFDKAVEYADRNSTCKKVHVGAIFVTDDGQEFLSCNNGGQKNCNELGYCYKARVTGIMKSCEATRPYCQSVHAEINMLKNLSDNNIDPSSGILFVSRYPCRNCLKKCIDAGIKHIKFCGKSAGSDDIPTQNPIDCKNAGVTYEWYPQFDYEY